MVTILSAIAIVQGAERLGNETDVAAESAPAQADRIIIRGWEITSAVGMRRPVVSEVAPVYRERKRVGDEKRTFGANLGGFLVVQVSCKWATSDAPNERLWVGRPNVVLLDGQGREFPAVDALIREKGDYIRPGMLSNPGRRSPSAAPPKNSRLLTYFDVPLDAAGFSLRFGEAGPVVPVRELADLPDAVVDLPD